MKAKALPGELELETPLKVGSTWMYSTNHGTEDLISENYFLEVQGYLAPMDRIRVYRTFEGGWDFAVFMVLVSDPARVLVEPMHDWRRFTLPLAGAEDTDGPLDGSLKVRKSSGAGYTIVNETGDVIAKAPTKAKAEAIARRQKKVA